MSYKNLLFSAYLRPKESPLANTRLFFGVEQETRTEKSKSGYNLKAAHSVFVSTEYNILSVEESNAVSG